MLNSPSRIFILGNLMDGGREWTDSNWETEWKRFQRVFKIPNRKGNNRVKLHTLAGNRDIGMGESVIPWAVQRFRNRVGPLNYAVEVDNHLLIALDTVLFENKHEIYRSESRLFLEHIKSNFPSKHKILLSHTPLYRKPGTDCGSFRKSAKKSIELNIGKQYKTMLDRNSSELILKNLMPDMILSADDYDNCHVVHDFNNKIIPEVCFFTLYFS
ncbi:hypothetical protein BB561_002223 [Smittium simulii]|uniref:Uncharacterized protein n=1 Tax=Smittium simulii TaxID=133385 RepID=A0A2T9YR58_9FUNG|nr:hypothetical protein BB561_002223 [Smittium simulii]